MDLAWITPGTPYPPDAGERTVTFNRIRRMAERGHDVWVLSVVDDEGELGLEAEMERHCTGATYALRSRGVGNYLRHPRLPYPAASRYVAPLQRRVEELHERVDAVVLEHTNVTPYGLDLDVPTCFGVHNVVSRTLFGMARSRFPSLTAVPYAVESARTRQYERRLYGRRAFDSYAFLSPDERASVVERFPGVEDDTWVSPIGVDVERFRGVTSTPATLDPTRPTVVFTGLMRYEPNVDAVQWFVERVLPSVRRSVPKTQFLVVGKEPAPRVERLGQREGVTVTGRVDAVEPYLLSSDVVVVPLRAGGGVKVKTLEGLAAGTPVVSTSVGTEGLAVVDGEHLYVEDDPGTFADVVAEVLRGERGVAAVTAAGREYVERRHAWPRIVDDLEERLAALASRGTATRP